MNINIYKETREKYIAQTTENNEHFKHAEKIINSWSSWKRELAGIKTCVEKNSPSREK